MSLHLEDGSAIEGEALVGADGVHSRIRQGLFGPDAPHDLPMPATPHVVWEALRHNAPSGATPTTEER